MTDAEYELKRLKEAIANRPDWEKLWAEQTERAEAAEAEIERLKGALAGLIEIIDAAGRIDVIGQTSWYVKASDRLDAARAALEAKP